MTDPRRPFALEFARLLEERGLNQSEAARELGVASSMVNRWINGTMPTEESIARIAKTFGVDAGYLWSLVTMRAKFSPASTASRTPKSDATLSEETQAQMRIYHERYDYLITRKVPRGMWKEYLEACDQLAESFRHAGDLAFSALPAELQDGPVGEGLRPLTPLFEEWLCQLVAN